MCFTASKGKRSEANTSALSVVMVCLTSRRAGGPFTLGGPSRLMRVEPSFPPSRRGLTRGKHTKEKKYDYLLKSWARTYIPSSDLGHLFFSFFSPSF